MFTVRFAKPIASQSFARLPRKIRFQFNAAFEGLSLQPRGRTAVFDVRQLRGYQNVWTLRISQSRGVYAIDGNEVVLIVFGPRHSVYASLHALLPPEGQYVGGGAD
jgi:mRNA-degrading endonuclease RelE of RelBE toxin-antitoxin system